ncbi:MAG: PAS domain S-box protein [Candidatus Accumulibacter sp.]|uniref:PAS domain S-box protein n=1 Tax=Accumulibacter sp. TaxID=2053492 RepID=UPI001AC54AE8|nr:PAS domain S-box protein [Accumulibacter sp.]MBN8437187.1 PAS domain S-box protein [Accumulibacter sp.]
MNQGTVLVVEDTLASLKLLTDTLSAAGYQVLPANSGELALAAVALKGPQLILLDLRMPGMDGFEVLRRLKARDESRDIPVMILSAVSEREQRIEGLKLGAVDFLNKPFEQEELLVRVSTQMNLSLARARLERQAADLRLANAQLQREMLLRQDVEDALRQAKEAAEEGLEQERRLLALVVSSSEDAIISKRLDGIITSWNHGAEKLFGYTAAEILGQPILTVIPPERHDEEERLLSAIRRGESIKHHETTRIAKDGHVLEVSVTLSPIRDHEGRIIGASKIARDISERRRTEQALARHRDELEERVLSRTAELAQARDAAEAANRAKSAFLANMSHELRTPLNGIMGMTDLALRRATDPKLLDWLQKGKGAALHLLAVINDILEISRIEAGRVVLEEQDFSLAQALDEMLGRQETAAREKGLVLSCTLAPTLPDLLRGDVFRLQQMLLNLVGNAIKFSERGQVRVSADALEEDSHSVLLRVQVSDQGIGLSADEQARLFHAFSQGDDSMTRKYGGTGLGLIICKRLARLMGGDVGVASEAGVGSTFWITARLRRATDCRPAGTKSAAEPPSGTPAAAAEPSRAH